MAVPNAPTDLVVTATAVGELYLTWVAPVAGDAPTGYTIYYGTETAVYTGSIDAGDVLAYTVDSLGNGDTYFYKVFAYNLDGESATGTDEESGTTWDVPGAPTGLTAIDGDASASLSWTAPTFNFGTAIVYYNIYRGVETGVLVKVGTSATTSYTSTGLTNGTTYFFVVTGSNVVGEGAQSSETIADPSAPGSTEVTNRFHTANGAINFAVFEFTNGNSWTVDIPTNKTVLGMSAQFTTSDNLAGTENIIVDKTNKTVKVYVANAQATNLYDVNVVVYYK